MNLAETFDSQLDLVWQQESWGEHAGFRHGDDIFILQFRNIQLLGTDYEIIEFSFYRAEMKLGLQIWTREDNYSFTWLIAKEHSKAPSGFKLNREVIREKLVNNLSSL